MAAHLLVARSASKGADSQTPIYGARRNLTAALLCYRSEAEVSGGPLEPLDRPRLERQRERRAGLERLVLDRLEAGVRAGACSDPDKSRGIDNTASPVEAAAVDQRRNACPVGERTVASMHHDG